MPTDKPRLNVTFDPYTYALISRMHELDGTPKARIVTEIVEAARPYLEAIIKAAEEFQSANEESKAAMLAAVEAAEKNMMPDVRRLQAQTLAAFDIGAHKR
ncbi:hypothetical protein GCM10009808_08560 [Microbacterium sediminicola]|uniref:Uncharacterized protein n=1 Tax=Microbacterium sediminicola TaxID=415210 RepID=A0ABN2HUE7_9MICO